MSFLRRIVAKLNATRPPSVPTQHTSTHTMALNISQYGRAHLITSSDLDHCPLKGQKYVTLDGTKNLDTTAFWNPRLNGWVVRGRNQVLAQEYVSGFNKALEETQPKVKEVVAPTPPVSRPLYSLVKSGDCFVIKPTDSGHSPLCGVQFLQLRSSPHPTRGYGFWSEEQEGWVVLREDRDDAMEFIRRLNKGDLGAIQIVTREVAELVEQQSPPPVESEQKEVPSVTPPESPPAPISAPLYFQEVYGKAFVIRCTDLTKCTFRDTHYLALDDSKFPPIAFWNEKIGGWLVRPKDKEAGEAFVRLANTHSRSSSPKEAPGAPQKPTRDQSSHTKDLKRSDKVVRQLFSSGASETKDDATESIHDDDDDDEDYVDEDEVETPTVPAASPLAPNKDQPYSGMKLRKTRDGDFYLTCSRDHHLHGRPWLGNPAAKKTTRNNCWFVKHGTEQQFVTGGAVYA